MALPPDKGPGRWCPENDGAYQAEMAAVNAPAQRCAECTCEHGGADCNWIAQPQDDDENPVCDDCGTRIGRDGCACPTMSEKV